MLSVGKKNITILFFASAREMVGKSQESLDIPENWTLKDVKEHIFQTYPSLTSLKEFLIFSVNQNFFDENERVPDNAEIALIPPVSGG
ncbi:MAG: MoaD/ThiS family protein [bacterium JZ-2024 1]